MPRITQALEQLRKGGMVVLVDDEDRENEGDLVLAAEHATAESVNFMIKHARGLVCLSLESRRVDELGLPMMTANNRTPRQTAFTVSIEAREGVSTGISAADRARTIQVACDPSKGAADIVSPGHVFPLRAVEGGVLVRAGHTEGSVDLARMAGLKPAAIICEIMKDDGTMARMQDLAVFAKEHGLPVVTMAEVISARMQRECLVEEVARTRFPTEYAGGEELELRAFRSLIDGTEHLAIVKGKPGAEPCLVRMHSECLTGDALGSLRCDCGPQLQAAIERISRASQGVVVYLRRHEGRGIGLANKIRAYALQDAGMDTVEANRHLGFQADLRNYGIGAQILKLIGLERILLMTNNPRKVVGLEGYGLEIAGREPIEIKPNTHNKRYLAVKREKLGHELNQVGPSV